MVLPDNYSTRKFLIKDDIIKCVCILFPFLYTYNSPPEAKWNSVSCPDVHNSIKHFILYSGVRYYSSLDNQGLKPQNKTTIKSANHSSACMLVRNLRTSMNFSIEFHICCILYKYIHKHGQDTN